MCLLSALRYHELTSEKPTEVWIALPRNAWTPRLSTLRLKVVHLSGDSFNQGIEEHRIEGVPVRIYSIAKTVADCFKFRNQIGTTVAVEALRDAWRSKRVTVDELWHHAKICRVCAQPPLPLRLAEIEAETLLIHSRARFIAAQLQDLPAKILEHPERAPHIADLAAKALAGAFDRIRAREGLSVRSPDEILALPSDPTENLLGARLLTRGGRLVIAGAGGVGKSRISLQLAASVIAGRDFLGLPSFGRATKWLILQAENDNVRLKADLGALRDWLGEDWNFVGPRLRIHTLETERDVFLSLDDDQSVAAIKRLIERESPDVVVWDSLYSFSSGDLNKDADMRETLTRLHLASQHGNPKRGIVVLHHATTGKSGVAKLTGFDRSSFGRNSKVLHSWTRGQINVGPLSADDNDTLGIACGKASNGREFPPFAIRLNPEAMIYELAPDVNVAEALEQAQTGKQPDRISEDTVADLAPGKTKADLAKAIMEKTGCVKGAAYKAIARAEEGRFIRLHTRQEGKVVKSLQFVSEELPRTGQRSVSSLHHPVGVETETTDPQKNLSEIQPDCFARRAMVLVVPYDLFPAVEFRIRQSGGHIAVMERQHRRGQYKLTVSLPLSAAQQFAIYENKSN